MNVINRAAIVVKPAKPFLDWLYRVDPTSRELSLQDFQEDPTVYLLPEVGDEAEARECLAVFCGQLFEEQLDSWYRVPSSWPKRRDLAAFERWFTWSQHSMVVDLSDEELLQEELRADRLAPTEPQTAGCVFGLAATGTPRSQHSYLERSRPDECKQKRPWRHTPIF